MYAICMRQRGHFTLKAAGTSTHCMHAAARALHSQGSAALSVFHALYACGSAGTFTLSLSRQRGGTWACLYVGGDGLPDCTRVGVCWSLFEFVGVCVESGGLSRAARVLWSGVASAGFGCRGPKKRRRADTEDEDTRGPRLLVAPRGATCWYGSTHASYGVSFSSTNHMNSPELTS